MPPVRADVVLGKVVQPPNRQFQKRLQPAGVIWLQMPGGQQDNHHDERHQDPADNH